MIFIVQENAYNGSVVVANLVTGVEATSFEEAKAIVRSKTTLKKLEAEGKIVWLEDSDTELKYRSSHDETFPLYGTLTNRPLTMIERDPE